MVSELSEEKEMITTFKYEETTEYEGTGFYYKADGEDNFANAYQSTGGAYVRRVRPVSCPPDQATHVSFDAMESRIRQFVGGEGRYESRVEMTMPMNLRDWLSRHNVRYMGQVISMVVRNGHHRGIPRILLRAAIGIAMYDLSNRSFSDNTNERNAKFLLLVKGIQPLYVD